MTYEVAQLALRANVRARSVAAQGVTVGDVAEVISKEDTGFVKIDRCIEKLFSVRGSNPVTEEQVRVYTEQK